MASSVRSHTYGVGEHALQANGQLLPRLTRTTRFAFANRARVTVVCVRVPIKPITQLEQTRARDPGNRRHDTIFANQGSRFRPFWRQSLSKQRCPARRLIAPVVHRFFCVTDAIKKQQNEIPPFFKQPYAFESLTVRWSAPARARVPYRIYTFPIDSANKPKP